MPKSKISSVSRMRLELIQPRSQIITWLQALILISLYTMATILCFTIVQGAIGIVSGGAHIFGHDIRAIFENFEKGEMRKQKNFSYHFTGFVGLATERKDLAELDFETCDRNGYRY